MSDDPYLIEGPALISFSGGRTSGYMLYQILQAHGGTLPDDVHVCFANTGKEREETLRFVHDCGTRWNVDIVWLEWQSRLKRTPVAERYTEVGYNSASRKGEPFERLIESKKSTPNQSRRWCTKHLKVQIMHDFMEVHGFNAGQYAEAVGLRADENWRYFKMLDRNDRDSRMCVAPLVKANVRKADVMAFWAEQPFDLGLRAHEGNCDMCFMKGKRNLRALIRANPEHAVWWDRMEQATGQFSSRYSMATLVKEVAASPMLSIDDEIEEFDAECGLWCSGEAA